MRRVVTLAYFVIRQSSRLIEVDKGNMCYGTPVSILITIIQ